MQSSGYVSPEEAAEYFQMNPETMRRLCREGKINGARKVGGRWKVPRSFLQSDPSDVQRMSEDEEKK